MASASENIVRTNAAVNQRIPVSEVEYQTTPCQLENANKAPAFANEGVQFRSRLAELVRAEIIVRQTINTKFSVGKSAIKKLTHVRPARPNLILFQKPSCKSASKTRAAPKRMPNTGGPISTAVREIQKYRAPRLREK